jgi:hypothetical protein
MAKFTTEWDSLKELIRCGRAGELLEEGEEGEQSMRRGRVQAMIVGRRSRSCCYRHEQSNQSMWTRF